MKVWEGKQAVGFLLTWRLLRHQLQQQTTDKYNRFQVVTLPSPIRPFIHIVTVIVTIRVNRPLELRYETKWNGFAHLLFLIITLNYRRGETDEQLVYFLITEALSQ